MRAGLTALLLALALAPLRADDPEPPTPKEAELKALQGTWQVTSAKSDSAPGDLTKATITFAKSKLMVRHGKNTPKESTFTIDPKKSPKQIDITFGGKTEVGIYKVEKGELHLCVSEGGNKVRPKSFTEKGALQLTLKRAKK
jgi:uncharacterized protein (TIGR03067 family)